MKLTADRPFADAAVAVRKLPEIANATEAVQDGRIYLSRSTASSCSRKAAGMRNTAPGSPTRLPRAGCGSTSLGRT
jgi:hypothetical protein